MTIFIKEKVHIGNKSDLVHLVYTRGSESIYKCPYCIIIRGKQDNEGKFYYNNDQKVGHCFKCESVIHDSSFSIDKILTPDSSKVTNIINQYYSQLVSIEHFNDIYKDSNSLKYMNHRGISLLTLLKYNVKSTDNEGVVFCNKYLDDGKLTDFYQIRYLYRSNQYRHYTPKGLLKPLCWIDHIHSKHLILVEGFTSGLSCYEYMNELSPLVMTGKSVSDLHIHQLNTSRIYYESLTVCCDGSFFSSTLKNARYLYDNLLNKCNIYVMKLPNDKDPNDLSKEEFITFYNRKVLYAKNNESIIKKYYE